MATASKVFRLYRELDKSLPDHIPHDLTYFRERKEVFDLLTPVSYEKHLQSLNRSNVLPLKHHGKMARIRGENRNSMGAVGDREQQLQQRIQDNKFRAVMQEFSDNRPALQHLQTCVEGNKPISSKTINRLYSKDHSQYLIKNMILVGDVDAARDAATKAQHSPGSNRLPPIQSATPSPSQAAPSPPRLMPCFQPPTVVIDQRRVQDRTKSQAKWSAEERARINSLFLEEPPPSTGNLNHRAAVELWEIYVQKLAERFHAFHPHRPVAEVRAKFRHYLKTRQLKVAGEEDFWQGQQGQRASQRLRDAYGSSVK